MTFNFQFGDRLSPTCLPLANFGADARVDTSSTPGWAAASK
jgi:hypothetical protein